MYHLGRSSTSCGGRFGWRSVTEADVVIRRPGLSEISAAQTSGFVRGVSRSQRCAVEYVSPMQAVRAISVNCIRATAIAKQPPTPQGLRCQPVETSPPCGRRIRNQWPPRGDHANLRVGIPRIYPWGGGQPSQGGRRPVNGTLKRHRESAWGYVPQCPRHINVYGGSGACPFA